MKIPYLIGVIALLYPFALSADISSACIQYQAESNIHITEIDLNCPNIELVGSQEEDKGITVSAFAEKYQTKAAINANFYWKDFTPIGLVVSNHKKISKYSDVRNRVIFACTARNQCWIEPKNQVTKFDPRWKVAVSGWHYYDQVSGKFECAEADKIGCVQDIFTGKHPRTMLGLNEKKNRLYLVVVEGRQFTFKGMTLNELAAVANRLELTKAINLDGGGSSTMVIDDKRVSALPFLQGEERRIANHLGVKLR